MKQILLLTLSAVVLASCGAFGGLQPKPQTPDVQIVMPLDPTVVLPPPVGANTAATLDTTTEAQRAAAVAAPVAGARELGKVTVALGSPAEPGFWLRTALVTAPGKGKVVTTGKLGEVMQESIQAALSVVRRRARSLGIDPNFYEKSDIHIHLPEGAIPKDGPSAGIAIATALVSVLTGIPVRCDVAMTGEITLRGEVLAIGGLKEKLLAAVRGGIRTALIPEENVKDLAEIPDNIKNAIEILPVKWIDRVLDLALERRPEPLADDATAATTVAAVGEEGDAGAAGRRAH